MQLAKYVVNLPSSMPANPEFMFSLDQELAQKIMFAEEIQLQLTDSLGSRKDSPLSYGSEFKPSEVLDPIFALHPNWNRMRYILENGSCWSMEDLPLPARLKDLE